MGGMMSLYFNVKYPDVFASSMFVSCQWDIAKMDGFKDKKFVYITAGGDKEATEGANQLKALLKKERFICRIRVERTSSASRTGLSRCCVAQQR